MQPKYVPSKKRGSFTGGVKNKYVFKNPSFLNVAVNASWSLSRFTDENPFTI